MSNVNILTEIFVVPTLSYLIYIKGNLNFPSKFKSQTLINFLTFFSLTCGRLHLNDNILRHW